MEIVEIGCPRSIDLLSLPGYKEKYKDAKSILETIDVYDYIIIRREIKDSTGILITSKEEISDCLKDDLKKIILIFSNYVGIKINDIIIDIKYADINCFRTNESILAGLLIALNLFFKTQLTIHELVYLSEKINQLTSYYIIGGYKKINEKDNNYSIGKNDYNKYVLLEKKFEDIVEEERLKKFLLNNNLKYGIDNIYYIAVKDVLVPSIPISIKREFPNMIIHTANNVSGHKILVKYLK